MEDIKNKNAKKRIRTLVNEYEMDNDLMKLAEAYALMKRIFKDENFPLNAYLKYRRGIYVK